MRYQSIVVPAIMLAGMAVGFAEEAAKVETEKKPEPAVRAEKPAPEKHEMRRMREGGDRRPDGVRLREMRVAEGMDGTGGRDMLIRMLEDPEACKAMGLEPEARKKIAESFKKIDESIDAKRKELGELQANQGKLISGRASEEEVMAAVDKVWKCRADIAKLQTSKVIQLRSHLSDEQIRKIDEARNERFRTRRMRQGDGAEGGKPRGPREEGKGKPEDRMPPPPKAAE